jgi:hypothetical protein
MVWLQVPEIATESRIQAFVTALRLTRPNGGVILALFRAESEAARTVRDLATIKCGGSENSLLLSFLASPEVSVALPELEVGDGLAAVPDFERLDSAQLRMRLVGDLVQGGAYRRLSGTRWQAEVLVRNLLEALCGSKGGDLVAFESSVAWSRWFKDVAWDATWIVVCPEDQTLCLLCETDTD